MRCTAKVPVHVADDEVRAVRVTVTGTGDRTGTEETTISGRSLRPSRCVEVHVAATITMAISIRILSIKSDLARCGVEWEEVGVRVDADDLIAFPGVFVLDSINVLCRGSYRQRRDNQDEKRCRGEGQGGVNAAACARGRRGRERVPQQVARSFWSWLSSLALLHNRVRDLGGPGSSEPEA